MLDVHNPVPKSLDEDGMWEEDPDENYKPCQLGNGGMAVHHPGLHKVKAVRRFHWDGKSM